MVSNVNSSVTKPWGYLYTHRMLLESRYRELARLGEKPGHLR